jgi:glycosyltransferase involved in cell wall biosynthesis
MAKVSVVIPVYNGERYIAEAIQSALSQSFKDFEVIVVDDGSTDNTPEIVSSFPVKNFRQENQGEPAARNRGVELSSGQYIAFLDADDIRLTHSLAKCVELLDAQPEAAFCYGQAYIIDGGGRFIGHIKSPSKHSYVRPGWYELKDMLLNGNHFTVSTVILRRSCLEEVGKFDLSLRAGSTDLDMWVRLAKKFPVGYIAEPLAKYRLHFDNFCAGRNLSEWEKTNSSIIECILNDASLDYSFSTLKPKAYFRFYLTMADHAYEQGYMTTAREYLLKGLKIRPRDIFSPLGLSWILQLVKTCMPRSVLTSVRNAKLYFMRQLIRETC